MLQAIVIGNLGADAEIKGQQGQEFTTFRVAHSERWKDEAGNAHEQTTWVDCTMNGKPAVFDYLKRGTTIAVIGNASLRLYSSPKDRCMKAGMRVSVRSVELIGGVRDAIPSRLYDDSGVQHDVTKFFHTDVAGATLFSQQGGAFTTDANGWVAPAQTQNGQESGGQAQDDGVVDLTNGQADGAQIF